VTTMRALPPFRICFLRHERASERDRAKRKREQAVLVLMRRALQSASDVRSSNSGSGRWALLTARWFAATEHLSALFCLCQAGSLDRPLFDGCIKHTAVLCRTSASPTATSCVLGTRHTSVDIRALHSNV
jgi:hypothetical protein